MDIFIIIFFLFSVGTVLSGFLIEGGSIVALLSVTSALIVFGGTIGAVGISFPSTELKRVFKILKVAFSKEHLDMLSLMDQLKTLCKQSRQEGILSLEKELDNITDPLMKKGLGLVVDGYDAEKIRSALELESEVISSRHEMGASIFNAAGGYAPTMGIIGTVLGLVHVLSNLAQPDELGSKIALAFIATFYGIASANLIWLPICNKLKVKNEHEMLYHSMIIDGIMMVHDGANPAYIEENLSGYLQKSNETKSSPGNQKKQKSRKK